MKRLQILLALTILTASLLVGCGGGGGGGVPSGVSGTGGGTVSSTTGTSTVIPYATPDAGATPTPTPTPVPNTTLSVTYSTGVLPTGTTTILATAYDGTGTTVFGRNSYAAGSTLTLQNVSNEATQLRIEYWIDQTRCLGMSFIPLSLKKITSWKDPPIIPAVTLSVLGRKGLLATPTWVACQDGPGAWTMLTASYTGLYAFPVRGASGAYGVGVGVLSTHGGTGGGTSSQSVFFQHATLAETATPQVKAEIGSPGSGSGLVTLTVTPTISGVQVSGDVFGMGGGESGRLVLTPTLFANLSDGGGYYAIANVSYGLYGVFALKGVGYQSAGVFDNSKIDSIFFDSLRIPSGSSDITFNADFGDTTKARPPVDRLAHLLGGGADTLAGTVSLTAPRESRVDVSTYDSATQTINYKGFPTASPSPSPSPSPGGGTSGGSETLIPLHLLNAVATDSTGFGIRTIQHFFLEPVDLDESFVTNPYGSVTMGAGSVNFTPYAGAQVYQAVLSNSATDATMKWTVSWTPGYLGGGSTYAYTFPNVAAISGLDSSWQYASNSQWTLEALNAGNTMTLEQLLAGLGEGSDGMRVVGAGQQGTLSTAP